MNAHNRHDATIAFVVALASLVTSFAHAQSSSPDEAYKTCLASNAESRKMLEAAPAMPELSRKLARLTIDDQICECMRSPEAQPKATQKGDAMTRYFAANSYCLAMHINSEFPPVCPELYADLLPQIGYPSTSSGKIDKLCACAAGVMGNELTPEALLQSQLDQYRYFLARVEDKKRGTNKATSLRPGPGAMERGTQGIRTCIISVLGEPRKPAQ